MKYLGDPKPLSDWIQESASYPADGWLYINENELSIHFNTLCWPCIIKSRDLSDEEYDEMESYLEQSGYKLFLGKAQIEEIVANLKQQTPSYSSPQIFEAINYYWLNDAFIQL